MLNKGFKGFFESPIRTQIFLTVIWAVITNFLFIFSDRIVTIPILYMLSFILIYPAYTLVICFKYAKRFTIGFVMEISMLVIIILEYFFVEHFSSIIPNMIVTTALCLLFGGGLGDVFADKSAINAQKENRRLKKLHEDKAYKKIVDD